MFFNEIDIRLRWAGHDRQTKKILGESLHVFGHSFRLKPATNEVADHGGLVAAYEAKKALKLRTQEGFSTWTVSEVRESNIVKQIIQKLRFRMLRQCEVNVEDLPPACDSKQEVWGQVNLKAMRPIV